MSRLIFFISLLLFTVSGFYIVNEKLVHVDVSSAESLKSAPIETPVPHLNKFSEVPPLTATAVFIMDAKTGATIYEKNADLKVAPASTTKIMTALTAVDERQKDEIITIPFNYTSIEGQRMRLLKGEKISFESLMYGLLVFSSNDAAEALARTSVSGRDGFIEKMNIKARSLGLTSSVFKNPAGLDESGHLTTAREMASLGKALMQNSFLRNIVGTKNATVYSSNLKIPHYLNSTNELLASVPGVIGIKTGWTEEARENLVTYIDRETPIIISLFGSDNRFGETKELIDWVYKNYLP